MSSSCVPAKEPCVLHDPNPGGASDTGGDTDSECGSLCTCTSSSMTSLATSVGHPNGSSVSLSPHPERDQGQSQSQPQGGSSADQGGASGQNSDANGNNPYIVVFVPPSMLPGRTRDCGNCEGQGALQTAFRVTLFTFCDFCPWVAGFVFIYYAFYWWGIGPGFSAFLFMMGSHALIRFIRARGEAGCGIPGLSNLPPGSEDTGPETHEEEEEEEEDDADEGPPDAPPEIVNESPPSYEVAVVKPPPYDLYYHLTPTQPRNQVVKGQQHLGDNNFLTVPQPDFMMTKKGVPPSSDIEDDEDVFLPSYQDAIRLSFRSDKGEDGVEVDSDFRHDDEDKES